MIIIILVIYIVKVFFYIFGHYYLSSKVYQIGADVGNKMVTNYIKAPFELNLERDFFSQDYHQDIFFYVYSNISKKIIAQGGGYQYKKNKKKLDGFGFSCNVDYLAELTL